MYYFLHFDATNKIIITKKTSSRDCFFFFKLGKINDFFSYLGQQRQYAAASLSRRSNHLCNLKAKRITSFVKAVYYRKSAAV